jgi:serine/threonine protein kinase
MGPYELIAPIGAGGMGEVFRARDKRLNRDVAIKVLPKEFASDPDRLRRFEQESKTLAALNHPNILTIHDAGVQSGAPYLVSELLEGKTLREELNPDGSGLPLRKAIDYALQIAQGLAAAHSKGIIHRDLKPENIFVTKGGRVKILDFGLAKLQNTPHSALRIPHSQAASNAPTLADSTQPGIVMGTPAYMSPEQVRGEPADHRSDIFAFGCVLYEMLSGTRAFRRDTPVESMNAVLTAEPADIATANPQIPAPVERITRRCLEKSPERRFQSASDLAFALENAVTNPSGSQLRPVSESRRVQASRLLPWAAVVALAVAGGLWLFSGKHPATSSRLQTGPGPRKFNLILPLSEKADNRVRQVVVSPDGLKLVYTTPEGLWLWRLDKADGAVLLASTTRAPDPFWSPDSQEVAYFDEITLSRVSLGGMRPVVLCKLDLPGPGMRGAGGAWLDSNRIVFTTGFSGLNEMSAAGGNPAVVLPVPPGEKDFHDVSALPAASGVLFVVHRSQGADSIAAWKPGGQRKILLQLQGSSLSKPVYSPSGHILFARDGNGRGLWAFPFNLAKLERTDQPFLVASEWAEPSVSTDGTLAYALPTDNNEVDPTGRRQFVWLDRSGNVQGTLGPPLPGLTYPRISSDGSRIVACAGESYEAYGSQRIWLFGVNSALAMRFTRGTNSEFAPAWSNDGQKVLFSRAANNSYELVSKTVQGMGPEEVIAPGGGVVTDSGNYLITERDNLRGYIFLSDKEKTFVPLYETGAGDTIISGTMSPDDRCGITVVAQGDQYELTLTEVEFTSHAAKTGQSWNITRGEGGLYPVWHPHGTALFYVSRDGHTLMSVSVKTSNLEVGAPTKVCPLPASIYAPTHPTMSGPQIIFAVAPDGERFLMMQRIEDKSAGHKAQANARVVLNWSEEFREKR